MLYKGKKSYLARAYTYICRLYKEEVKKNV